MFLFRDLAILLGTLILLFLQPTSQWLQLLLGAGLGVCAYLFHEWAHLIGARIVGARLSYPGSWYSPFLFSFDSTENTIRQFVHMTWPGFAATAIYISTFYAFLPHGLLWADVAWIIAGLLAAATVVIEGPIALWIVFKKEVPAVEIPLIGKNRVLESLVDRFRSSS